jgi:hypothetical protein
MIHKLLKEDNPSPSTLNQRNTTALWASEGLIPSNDVGLQNRQNVVVCQLLLN